MSDIKSIIELIGKGHSNSDHKEGQRQINEAVAMLIKMQAGENLLFSQRHKLSKILECESRYDDIENAVKDLKHAQQWQPIETADMDCFGEILGYETENGNVYRTSFNRDDGAWLISSTNEIWNPTHWIPLPV